jgi:hypothetical protein
MSNDWTKDREICDVYLGDDMTQAEWDEYTDRARTRWPAALDEIERLRSLLARVAVSGILCDPGCCGDDCACDEIRAELEGEER